MEIRFRIGCVFQHFSVSAAPMTESYYTSGTYPMNALAAAEKTAVLRLCSMRGISLKLGFYDMEINDECLEVRLLWTI